MENDAITKPPKIKIGHTNGRLVISWHWFNWPSVYFMFVILVLGLISYFYLIPSGEYLLLLIFFSISAFLFYISIAGFLNRTQIKIDDFELEIKHGPVPWPGNQSIKRTDIVQLFTFPIYNGKRTVAFNLTAILANGERKRVLSHMRQSHEALFIEQEVESYLGLKNEPVDGEYGDKLPSPETFHEAVRRSDETRPPAAERPAKKLIRRPKYLKARKTAGEVWLQWKWNKQLKIRLFLGIIFVITFFPSFLVSPRGEALQVIISISLITPFWLAGFFLTYSAIAGYLNKTTVSLDPGNLYVTHEPLPWRNRKLDRDEITQLYTKKVRIKNNRYTYHLMAILSNGKHQKLFSTGDPEIPMYIAQELEDRMDIEDIFVEEEFLWEYKPTVDDFKELFTFKYKKKRLD